MPAALVPAMPAAATPITVSAASVALVPAVPSAQLPPPASAVRSLSDLINAAAAELRGGAQNISATTRALALLTQIPAGEAREALTLVAGVSDESARALLYKYILSHWAETHPREALRFASEELPEQHRLATAEGVLAAWAARDPEAVIGWNR